MSHILVIAEKPSVASDIAKALGGFKKDGDAWVNEEYIIASAVGHLLELVVPEEFEVKRGKWTFAHLPVLPPYFDLKPIARSASKLNGLHKHIRSRKVDRIINACDAGREGELIFRYIMQATQNKKPISRLWLQSMTKESIRTAFTNLRSDEEMKNLESAARARSEADWLVGINGTRAMTAFNSKSGGFFLTTVGRVQTPTLAIVVERENRIKRFVPSPYWEINATFLALAGEYSGIWFDPKFKKNNEFPHLKADRILTEEQANAIVSACRNKTGVVTETKKRTKQLSGALFDLTTLQREANARYGFSASTTLSIAQALYERHKLLTYPRTDAKALPEDYVETAKEVIASLSKVSSYESFSNEILKEKWVQPTKRVFDNSKISDHFAIIPTGQKPGSLSEAEAKIFDLVTRRFLAVFYPAAEYDVTSRITKIDENHFRSDGKVLVVPGFLLVTSPNMSPKESMCPVQEGEIVKAIDIKSDALLTRPPARYTEATLLSAMESAGKLVDNEELRDAMQDKGLGTPATRASTIEGLIDQKYMMRQERELVPLAKAFQLITLLKGLSVNSLTEPALTGEWEHQLALIERGALTRESFMVGIREMTEHMVESAKQFEGETIPLENPAHLSHPCPACGGEVVETYQRFACKNPSCDFSISKHPSGRMLELDELEELFANHHVGPLSGFFSKQGWPFKAELKLVKNPEWKMEFDFGETEEKVPVDLDEVKNAPTIALCPICQGRVIAHGTSYVCENALKEGKKCSFRVAQTILQNQISEEQIKKLLNDKKTDLLEGFISKRTNRAFSSYLVLNKSGKVGFEFLKKEPKKSKDKEK